MVSFYPCLDSIKLNLCFAIELDTSSSIAVGVSMAFIVKMIFIIESATLQVWWLEVERDRVLYFEIRSSVPNEGITVTTIISNSFFVIVRAVIVRIVNCMATTIRGFSSKDAIAMVKLAVSLKMMFVLICVMLQVVYENASHLHMSKLFLHFPPPRHFHIVFHLYHSTSFLIQVRLPFFGLDLISGFTFFSTDSVTFIVTFCVHALD